MSNNQARRIDQSESAQCSQYEISGSLKVHFVVLLGQVWLQFSGSTFSKASIKLLKVFIQLTEMFQATLIHMSNANLSCYTGNFNVVFSFHSSLLFGF